MWSRVQVAPFESRNDFAMVFTQSSLENNNMENFAFVPICFIFL